jgi:GNAT superfamily N-acetyltransferase
LIGVVPILQDITEIVLLSEEHELTAFQSTNADLNDFLKYDSLRDQKNLITKTYLCSSNGTIIGYFSMLADTIDVHAIDVEDGVAGYPYRKYPTIKIARLAVDERFERKGFGRFSVLAAIGLALSVTEIIGCRYLMVDSKPESVNFYKKLGFKIIDKYKSNDYPRMYLDMYQIVEMI